MTSLASHLQLKPQFVDTRFANLIFGINAKRIDIIASALYVTPERAKQIDFVPCFKTGDALLALTGSGFARATPDALCGKRVSSIKGASWIPKLAKVSQDTCATKNLPIDVREFETSPQASQALLAHAVDAQFEDSAVAKMTVDKMSGRLEVAKVLKVIEQLAREGMTMVIVTHEINFAFRISDADNLPGEWLDCGGRCVSRHDRVRQGFPRRALS